MQSMNWLNRFFSAASFASAPPKSAPSRAAKPAVGGVEALEGRALLAAGPGPRVVDVFADNRGQVVLTFDKALNSSTVNAGSVQLLTGGSVKPSTATYDAATKQVRVAFNTEVKANTVYTIQLVAKKLKGADGAQLDGEFAGDNKPSGNGKAGGNFVAQTAVNKKLHLARLSTTLGDVDFKLFHKDTPKAVANFEAYANRGDYDGTFFHRFAKDFGMMGGEFFPKEGSTPGRVKQRKPIKNEPRPGKPGNVFGTIAVARNVDDNPNTTTDRNSGQSRWFINFGDNRQALDRYEGGTAVFGKITDKKGKTVLQKLNKQATAIGFGSGFNAMPIRDPDALNARGGQLDPEQDLYFVNRAAIRMALVAPSAGATSAKARRGDVATHGAVARPSHPFATHAPAAKDAGVFGDAEVLLA